MLITEVIKHQIACINSIAEIAYDYLDSDDGEYDELKHDILICAGSARSLIQMDADVCVALQQAIVQQMKSDGTYDEFKHLLNIL